MNLRNRKDLSREHDIDITAATIKETKIPSGLLGNHTSEG